MAYLDPDRARLAAVIAKMKAGAKVAIRPGPLYDEYGWDPATGLYVDTIEWTHPSRSSCSEQSLAEAIARDPEAFESILR